MFINLLFFYFMKIKSQIRLYLDIDGVLLTKRSTKPAEYSNEFIRFIVEHFDCYWLTTHCKGNLNSTWNYLRTYYSEETMCLLKTIKCTNWQTLKTEAIDFDIEFIWIEDGPFDSEIKVLKSRNSKHKLFVVNLNRKNELLNLVNKLKFKI